MSTASAAEKGAVNGIRTAFGVGGVIALIVGILILVWPAKTAVVVAAIIAIYAIAGGLVYAGLGIFSKAMGGWARVGHIVLGLLFIVAGIIAFFNLNATTAWLAVFLGILVGIMWIVEGVVALTTLGSSASKGWSVFFAIISIIAGIVLLFSPLWGAVVLWWLLGIALVVLGIVQIIRAFTFKGRSSGLATRSGPGSPRAASRFGASARNRADDPDQLIAEVREEPERPHDADHEARDVQPDAHPPAARARDSNGGRTTTGAADDGRRCRTRRARGTTKPSGTGGRISRRRRSRWSRCWQNQMVMPSAAMPTRIVTRYHGVKMSSISRRRASAPNEGSMLPSGSMTAIVQLEEVERWGWQLDEIPVAGTAMANGRNTIHHVHRVHTGAPSGTRGSCTGGARRDRARPGVPRDGGAACAPSTGSRPTSPASRPRHPGTSPAASVAERSLLSPGGSASTSRGSPRTAPRGGAAAPSATELVVLAREDQQLRLGAAGA